MNIKSLMITAALATGATMGVAHADVPNIDLKEGPNGEITVLANLEVKPGAEEDFEKAMRLSARCSRLEPGNVTFEIYKILDGNKATYSIHEVWRTKAFMVSHVGRPYAQAVFAAWGRDLAKPPTDGMKFAADLEPAHRSKPAKTDPKSVAECR